MGFRFHRSISLGKMVRLNFSKRGVGASIGVPGFRVGIGSDGRVRRTVSLPGTGISHTQTIGGGRARQAALACPNCGGRVGKTDHFCRRCGAELK